ncbi:MAG: family intrarane metalloprotease protein [Glaciihabitans sp.]|nr:family intrarane metalloprotease protein [Glaciihabitans sp.]
MTTSTVTAATVPNQDGVAYHRLDRTDRRYRWWKPLLVLVVAFVLFVIMTLLVVAVVEVVAQVTLDRAGYADYSRQLVELNVVITNPYTLVSLLGGLAVMIPALWLARLIVRAGPFGRLSSVAGHLRWRWLAIALLPAIAYMAVQSLIGYIIAPAITGDSLGEPSTPTSTYLACLVVILLLVPLQASAEEYVFRGFVMQAVGGWLRWPLVALVASVIPFTLGHAYNWWGLAEIVVFAVVAAWLTLRTGGLEAAIGVHVLTNVLAFGIPALGFANVTEANGSPESLILALILLPLYAWAVLALFRRTSYSATRRVDVVVPLPTSPRVD